MSETKTDIWRRYTYYECAIESLTAKVAELEAENERLKAVIKLHVVSQNILESRLNTLLDGLRELPSMTASSAVLENSQLPVDDEMWIKESDIAPLIQEVEPEQHADQAFADVKGG